MLTTICRRRRRWRHLCHCRFELDKDDDVVEHKRACRDAAPVSGIVQPLRDGRRQKVSDDSSNCVALTVDTRSVDSTLNNGDGEHTCDARSRFGVQYIDLCCALDNG